MDDHHVSDTDGSTSGNFDYRLVEEAYHRQMQRGRHAKRLRPAVQATQKPDNVAEPRQQSAGQVMPHWAAPEEDRMPTTLTPIVRPPVAPPEPALPNWARMPSLAESGTAFTSPPRHGPGDRLAGVVLSLFAGALVTALIGLGAYFIIRS